LVNDRQELGGEGVEVDLLVQAGGERLDGGGGVVLASVEAAVNRLLDAAPGRSEHCARRQRRAATSQLGGPVPTPTTRMNTNDPAT
jgi:hypothetical protein